MANEPKVKVEKPKDNEAVFMFTEAGWGYVIVPDENIVLNGKPYHQRGVKISPAPGQPFRTKDPVIIEGLRKHRDYHRTILEYGVDFGDKVHAVHTEE